MKAFLCAAIALTITAATAPTGYACDASTRAANPPSVVSQDGDKSVASEPDLAVLLGLLLGLALAEPVVVTNPCSGCADAY